VLGISAPLVFVNAEAFKTQVFQKSVQVDHELSPTLTIETNGLIEEKTQNIQTKESQTSLQGKISTKHLQPTKLHAVNLDCSAMSYIDVVGLNALKEVGSELLKQDICFCLAEVPRPTAQKMEIAGVISPLDNENGSSTLTIYPTVHDAVALLTN
jgi:anti-anti-sigma regulatory factor